MKKLLKIKSTALFPVYSILVHGRNVKLNVSLLQRVVNHNNNQIIFGSSGDVVVKLLASRARVMGPGLVATISENGCLLLPSRDMAERLLKRRKSL